MPHKSEGEVMKQEIDGTEIVCCIYGDFYGGGYMLSVRKWNKQIASTFEAKAKKTDPNNYLFI